MQGNNFLKYPILMSKATGQWQFEHTSALVSIYNKFSDFLLIIFIFCTHYIVLALPFYYKCEKALIEIIFYYVHFIIAIVLTVLLKSKSIRSFLRWIIRYEKSTRFEHQQEIEIYQYYCKMNNNITVFFVIVINIVSWMWYALNKRVSPSEELGPHCPDIRGYVFKIWYPFEIEDFPWICATFDFVTVFCGMMLFCYYKIMPMSLIIFLMCQLNLLKFRIRSFDETKDRNGLARSERLAGIFRMHQLCIRLMNWIQYSLKEIILIQYCSYVLDTAAFMIQLLTEETMRGKMPCFAGFMMTVIQMYIFFWFANEIQEESKTLSDVIYNEINWIDACKSEKKMLMLMMMRSQQMLTLKVAAIGDLSLNSFTKIMRLCYSVVTFFTTVYDK
ncbi:unnamed protein product [Phyllotreta striolata]|uniref:Odorant receptor n=1 Tax=Phyllotreta striolata TaxID=444603 RepID=A0A9N9TQF9_PHYSR|nr:unnamed protein product [Phyllotreta striolata]